MAIPLTMIPVALSAVRSLVHLRQRAGEIREAARVDDPLPLMLPELPPNLIRNQTKDPGRMRQAFSQDPMFRAALEARGVLEHFDQFEANKDPLTNADLSTERHRSLFWRFMGLYYKILDQKDAPAASDVEVDPSGFDRYLVRSAEAGGGSQGLKLLRATAETLVEFLGDNAGVFLARSPNKLILSAVLREFAARTDLETDSGERILKVLVGSVAVAAADHGQEVTDSPAAAMLFVSLGRVRTDMGEDFVARIVSHEGFAAVVSDWVGSVAQDPLLVELLADLKGLDDGSYDPADPSTLPFALQPVVTALRTTLGVVGQNIGTGQPLERETVFRDVLGAVLSGLSSNANTFLREGLDGDLFQAKLLEMVIGSVNQIDAVRQSELIAPIFAELTETMAGLVETLGQDQALGRAEALLLDLVRQTGTDGVQATLAELSGQKGDQFARDVMVEVFALARRHMDLSVEGEGEQRHALAALLFEQVPAILQTGLERDHALDILGQALEATLPEDTPGTSLALALLPQITALADRVAAGRPALRPDDVEMIFRTLSQQVLADNPVWQTLGERGHTELIFDVMGHALTESGIPQSLANSILIAMSQEVVTSLGRHGLKLADFAELQADPQAAMRALLEQMIQQAVDAALSKLGRDAGASDLAPLVGAVLRSALAGETPAPLSDEALLAVLDRAILELAT